MKTLLSPAEIKSSMRSVADTTELFKDIRNGNWNAELIIAVVEQLDHDIQDKLSTGEFAQDSDRDTILAFLGVLFAAKDIHGYHGESREYQAIRRLHGRIIAALGF